MMASEYSEEEINYLREHYPSETNEEISKELDRSKKAIGMKASRLGLEKEYERTTNTLRKERLPFDKYSNYISAKEFNNYRANYMCGLVTAEGSFYIQEVSENHSRYSFSVGMSEKDKELVQFMCKFFEGGNDEPYHSNNNRDNQEDCKQFVVQSREQIVLEVIPLMEKYLREGSSKWKQYENWRNKLLNELELKI